METKTAQCPFCDKQFVSGPGMTWHVDHHHTPQKEEFRKSFLPAIREALKGNVATPRHSSPKAEATVLKCDLCPKTFTASVALRFHVRDEHPGAYEASAPILNRIARDERKAAKLASDSGAGEMPPSLRKLWELGCPCGRDHIKEWEARQKQGLPHPVPLTPPAGILHPMVEDE